MAIASLAQASGLSSMLDPVAGFAYTLHSYWIVIPASLALIQVIDVSGKRIAIADESQLAEWVTLDHERPDGSPASCAAFTGDQFTTATVLRALALVRYGATG